ncbi:MAG: tetratricopeptide repeat protein, partial [Candidatus Electrothrix sp. AX5]|nr:tetratricopeptide repeat protein [Candidatus Electrothrix sp. AX5]
AFEADLEKHDQGRILHVINLESLGESDQQAFFKGLNYHREHIARNCAGILAFWLPGPLVREMALQAADFWAWREQVLDFTVPVESVERAYTSLVAIANIDISSKHKRIQEIEKFLANSSDKPSSSHADLQDELGVLYQLTGEYKQAKNILEAAIAEHNELDNAESSANTRLVLADLLIAQGNYDQAINLLKEQVMPVFQRLKKEAEHALTLGKIADILEESGELDEALEIRKKKELPVYKRLKLESPKVRVMGKIADILVARGEYNKALRIWRQECLPIYERLGDVREAAITQGRIADVYEFRGQLEKSLTIRRKEELPIYKKLGDVREEAVTLGKIAGILQMLGELDKALEIRETKQLPVFERLGDIRELLICRTNIAFLLQEMNNPANEARITELLRLALADAKRLKLPKETTSIEKIMEDMHIKPQ